MRKAPDDGRGLLCEILVADLNRCLYNKNRDLNRQGVYFSTSIYPTGKEVVHMGYYEFIFALILVTGFIVAIKKK